MTALPITQKSDMHIPTSFMKACFFVVIVMAVMVLLLVGLRATTVSARHAGPLVVNPS
jgi:hypothetical protein